MTLEPNVNMPLQCLKYETVGDKLEGLWPWV